LHFDEKPGKLFSMQTKGRSNSDSARYDHDEFIWNPVPLDRIGQNGTSQYVPVHTGTTWYRSVRDFHIGTRQYVPVHTTY
jgi:hypothetical protein